MRARSASERSVGARGPPEQSRRNIHAHGRDTETVRGRSAAVESARTMSAGTRAPVHLERSDRRVMMVFQGGSLETYTEVTGR